MVSETTKKTSLTIWVRRISALILAFSFILLVINVFHLNVVPVKYLWFLLPLYGIIVTGIVWLQLRSNHLVKRWRLITSLVMALVLVCLNTYGLVVLHTANGLLGNIQSANTSYVTYAIIAKKDSATTVDNAKTIAIVSADPLYDKVSEALRNETPAAQQPVKYLANLKNTLANNDVEIAAVREESLNLIKDQDEAFYNSLTTLRTFRVEADKQGTAQHLDATKPYAIYISGIDTYGNISTVSRSDVNMLAVINPAKRTVLLVNTPRDYYVKIHNVGDMNDKLTHAGLYGVDTSRQTIEDLYDVTVPYDIRINFTTLVKVIDEIGPIDVYSDYDFKSYHQGMNTLDSKQALEFSRERHSFEEGDRQRGKNQQHVIEAIITKMSKPENAVRLPQIMSSLQDSVETNLSEDSLKGIVRNQLADIRGWHVTSVSADGTGAMLPTYSYGTTPLYVMEPDQQGISTLRQQIKQALAE